MITLSRLLLGIGKSVLVLWAATVVLIAVGLPGVDLIIGRVVDAQDTMQAQGAWLRQVVTDAAGVDEPGLPFPVPTARPHATS
jgi:hypothetical protein